MLISELPGCYAVLLYEIYCENLAGSISSIVETGLFDIRLFEVLPTSSNACIYCLRSASFGSEGRVSCETSLLNKELSWSKSTPMFTESVALRSIDASILLASRLSLISLVSEAIL